MSIWVKRESYHLLQVVVLISGDRHAIASKGRVRRLAKNEFTTLGQVDYPQLRIMIISINLLVVYRESVNLIGYITRRLFNN